MIIRLTALMILIFSTSILASPFNFECDHLHVDQYVKMIDEDGNILMESARIIEVGDEYLTSENYLYEVIAIEGDIARAKLKEKVQLPDRRHMASLLGWDYSQDEEREIRGIAFYHTHNAESYVPTDGTHSINGKGGIHSVGETFRQVLEELGIPTYYDETLHLPHDRGAYNRSRPTVMRLMENEPDAIFDIHRDAAPVGAYAFEIDDLQVTQVQLVVGRQNHNFSVNRDYAQSLKRISDMIHPGLVKGIFFGRGNYNQDITPLNVLLEVGAHTNSKDAAEKGIGFFAEAVDFYFYGPQEDRLTADPQGGPRGGALTAIRTMLTMLAIVFIGVIAFFVINSGGWAEARRRLTRLWPLGPRDDDD